MSSAQRSRAEQHEADAISRLDELYRHVSQAQREIPVPKEPAGETRDEEPAELNPTSSNTAPQDEQAERPPSPGRPQRITLAEAAVSQHLSLAKREAEAGTQALAAVEAALSAALDELQPSNAAEFDGLRRLEHERIELDKEWIRTRRQRRRIAAALRLRRDDIRKEASALRGSTATDTAAECPSRARSDGAAEQAEVAAPVSEELLSLRNERDKLIEQLAAVAVQAENPAAQNVGNAAQSSELERRFKLAVDDLQTYKMRVTELESQLELAHADTTSNIRTSGGLLDWESQKSRLLAGLDSGDHQECPLSREDHLTVKGTVRITDEVVAAKDREIAELRRRVQDLTIRVSDPTGGATAITETLDGDAVIAEERNRLRLLQEEIRLQQRKAAVELAVERARIARDRAEIEEKAHAMAAELAQQGAVRPGQADAAKPVRGRWLTKLGLRDTHHKEE